MGSTAKACLGVVALSVTSAVTTVAVARLIELTHGDIELSVERCVEWARATWANECRLATIETTFRRERRALITAAEWETYSAATPKASA